MAGVAAGDVADGTAGRVQFAVRRMLQPRIRCLVAVVHPARRTEMIMDIKPPRTRGRVAAIDVGRAASNIGTREITEVVLFVQHIPARIPPVPCGRPASCPLAPFTRAVVLVRRVALGREIGRDRRELVAVAVGIRCAVRPVRI